MHIVTKARLDEYSRRYADARASLVTWWTIAEKAHWRHIADVKGSFPHADYDSGTQLTIFNIKGNSYRLRVMIDYERHMIFIHDFMTHSTYDKLKKGR